MLETLLARLARGDAYRRHARGACIPRPGVRVTGYDMIPTSSEQDATDPGAFAIRASEQSQM